MHKAAGAFGGLNVYARSVIAVPYPTPAEDFTLLIGDWFKTSHKVSNTMHNDYAPMYVRVFVLLRSTINIDL